MSLKHIVVSFTNTIILIIENYIIKVTSRENIAKLLTQLPASLFPKYRLVVNAAIVKNNRRRRTTAHFKPKMYTSSSSSDTETSNDDCYDCCTHCHRKKVNRRRRYNKNSECTQMETEKLMLSLNAIDIDFSDQLKDFASYLMQMEDNDSLEISFEIPTPAPLPLSVQEEENISNKTTPQIPFPPPLPLKRLEPNINDVMISDNLPRPLPLSSAIQKDPNISSQNVSNIPRPPPLPSALPLPKVQQSLNDANPSFTSSHNPNKITAIDIQSIKLKPVSGSDGISCSYRRPNIIESKDYALLTPPLRRITPEVLQSVKLKPIAAVKTTIPKTPDVFDMVNVLRRRYLVMHSPLSDTDSSDSDFNNSSFAQWNDNYNRIGYKCALEL